MKKIFVLIAVLIVLSLAPASGGPLAPSDYWQIVYQDQKGNNHSAKIAATTAADALAAFEAAYGDQFITCMARTDLGRCFRPIGESRP